MKLIKNNLTVHNDLKNGKNSEALWCYLMIMLPLIGFLVLQVYPILWTFKWSFYSYNGIISQTKFIGIKNFITMVTTDYTYWKVWWNTLLFTIIKLPIEISFAMILALLLNKKLRGSGFFQAMFYLPNIISVVIVGLILSNMFNYRGLINALLLNSGIIDMEIDWFSNKATSMAMIIMGHIWIHFGVNVMYLLAALSNVPTELYESANLDGATKFTIFFKVTLPMIAPIFQVILLLSILNCISLNEFVIVLTNGGPYGQTNTVMSYLYTKFVPGFADNALPALGYGCAMSLVTTIIFAVIAVFYNKLSDKLKSIY